MQNHFPRLQAGNEQSKALSAVRYDYTSEYQFSVDTMAKRFLCCSHHRDKVINRLGVKLDTYANTHYNLIFTVFKCGRVEAMGNIAVPTAKLFPVISVYLNG